MSPSFEEGRQAFTFSDEWNVFRYDREPQHRRMMAVSGEFPDSEGTSITKVSSRAVDFLGTTSSTIWFIEVKDFRQNPGSNRVRWRDGDLALEVATKVRDSLAGLMAGVHADDRSRWLPFAQTFLGDGRAVHVLLIVETDPLPGLVERKKHECDVIKGHLKRKLKWLLPKVHVVTPGLFSPSEVPGLRIENLPSAVGQE